MGKFIVEDVMLEPTLMPIKGGWAALGDGWAVFGESKDDAIEKFRQAESQHDLLNKQGQSGTTRNNNP